MRGGVRLGVRAGCLLALFVVAGCGASAGTGGERACTMIGSRQGVGVEIAAGLDPDPSAATVEVCWDGSCRTVPVGLYPATEVGETTCTGGDPDDVCSAQTRETGGSHGFADVAELPERPMRVTLTVTDDRGERLAHRTLRASPEPVYPNGPHCPAGGPQLTLAVAADGTVRVAR